MSLAEASPSQEWPLFWPSILDLAQDADEFEGHAIGDFDGDAHLDLAGVSTFSHEVRIILGRGDGSFGASSSYAAGDYPTFIAVGDFDNDGNEDLAVTNSVSHTIAILMGAGDGSFGPPSFYDTTYDPAFIAIGDFDEDANEDVAAVSGDEIAVFIGEGDGTFGTASYYGPCYAPQRVVIGDFNEDGHQDLAVSNNRNLDLKIFLGAGDGSFVVSVVHEIGPGYPVWIAVGDFNEDRHQDLVAVMDDSYNGQYVSILLGDGDVGFDQSSFYPTDLNPTCVAVGDFDESGHQDLAVTNRQSEDIVVFIGNGEGSFLVSESYISGVFGGLPTVVIGDFDEDGHEDLASANSILTGRGDGTFQVAASPEAGNRPTSVGVGDFNADGDKDLAVTNLWSDDVAILIGNGDGSFRSPSFYSVGDAPEHLVVGDLDGNGTDDLVMRIQSALVILLGRGDGSFPAPDTYVIEEDHSGPMPIAIANLNEDGHPDVAAVLHDSVSIFMQEGVHIGTQGVTFAPATVYPVDYSPRGIGIGDLDGDGNHDLAVVEADVWNDGVAILLGRGDGTFAPATHYDVDYARSVAIGDFDGDGIKDLAVISHDVAILMGEGAGTFGPPSYYLTGLAPSSIAIGDLTGDGIEDLAVTNEWDYNVTILIGQGDGTFEVDSNYGVGSSPVSVAVGDFDSDEHDDLAVANNYSTSNDVTILLGNWKEAEVKVDSPLSEVPGGGSLPFTATITNTMDSTISFDIDVRVKLVGGNELPGFGPQSISLQKGQTLTREGSFDIPADASPGDYIVSLEVTALTGVFLDEDSFRVAVIGATGSESRDPPGIDGTEGSLADTTLCPSAIRVVDIPGGAWYDGHAWNSFTVPPPRDR